MSCFLEEDPTIDVAHQRNKKKEEEEEALNPSIVKYLLFSSIIMNSNVNSLSMPSTAGYGIPSAPFLVTKRPLLVTMTPPIRPEFAPPTASVRE